MALRPAISLRRSSIVNRLDRGLAAHRAPRHGRRVLADGFVDEIFVVIVAAAYRPLETDRGHRPGTDLEIAVAIGLLGRERLVLDDGDGLLLGLALRLHGRIVLDSVTDAGDSRQRMVGWIAATHDQASGFALLHWNRCPRFSCRFPFLACE